MKVIKEPWNGNRINGERNKMGATFYKWVVKISKDKCSHVKLLELKSIGKSRCFSFEFEMVGHIYLAPMSIC